MSKYIQNRLNKINELSLELIIINERIVSYINIFKDLEDKHKFFKVNDYSYNNIKQDKSIFNKNFSIYFSISQNYFDLNFDLNKFDFRDRNVPIDYILLLSPILEDFKKYVSFENIHNDIKLSQATYQQIAKIYEEIELKKSDFLSNSDFIIDYSKKNLYGKNIFNDSGEVETVTQFFKLVKNNKNKLVNINSCKDETCISFKVPKLDKSGKFISNKYTLKEYIFKLNKPFFDFFDLKEENFSFYTVYDINLSFSGLNNDKINTLFEKFQLANQLSEF